MQIDLGDVAHPGAVLFAAAEAAAIATSRPRRFSRKQAKLIRPRFRTMIATTKPVALRVARAVGDMRDRFWRAATLLENPARESNGPDDVPEEPDAPPPIDHAQLDELLRAADEMGPDELAEALQKAGAESYRDGEAHVRLEMSAMFDGPDERAIKALDAYYLEFATSVSEDEMAALKAMLREAFEDGVSIDGLAHEIAVFFQDGLHRTDKDGVEHVVDVDEWAQTVARTETARAQNAGQLDSYARTGVEKIIWIAASDERVCPICRPLDGVAVETGTNFPGVGVPAPPAHPSCRCTIVGLSEITKDLLAEP